MALRPKLQTLPRALENVDWDSAREERRRYMEGRTRTFLDERRGELGDAGEEMEGGRKRAEEEVGSLEAIVGTVAEGSGDRRMEG